MVGFKREVIMIRFSDVIACTLSNIPDSVLQDE